MIIDRLPVTANVRIRAYEKNVLVDERVSHNVLTNVGRKWLRDLVGAATYANVAGGQVPVADSLTSERVRYVAFGVGGVLASDPYYHLQDELPSVIALEDYVKVDASGKFLLEVEPQSAANASFPDNYTIKFTCALPESVISFAANTSKSSDPTPIGTNVPITEIGLYLSGSNPSLNLDELVNSSRLVAYSVDSPMYVNANVVLKIEWEFRF